VDAVKVLIIGGGASGLMAAVFAARAGAEVVVAERQGRVGRKLAATGNGRCNITNTGPLADRYHGEDSGFAAAVLARYDAAETLALFRSLGLVTVEEPGGRVYPLSDQAGSVVDVLRYSCAALGVRLRTGCEVLSLSRAAGGFAAACAGGELMCADRVVVAAGGAAGGRLGGGKSGYELLRGLGHSCTKLYPSLVQLKTESEYVRPLKGVRAQAGITLRLAGQPVAACRGEVQFTDYGVSGPGIFDISRGAVQYGGELVLDLMPDISREELEELLRARTAQLSALETGELFTGMLHNRLGRVLVKRAGLPHTEPLGALTQRERAAAAALVKSFSLQVIGSQGMDMAQVTAGGVRTEEFDGNTMESRLCPGLYACGEVLDIDGDCGGFNLQWAWSSGAAAGSAAGGGAP